MEAIDDFLSTPGSIAFSLTAILALLGLVFLKVVLPAYRYMQAIHEIVERELTPNSGRSMKDTVIRTEVKLDAHLRWSNGIMGKLVAGEPVTEADRENTWRQAP